MIQSALRTLRREFVQQILIEYHYVLESTSAGIYNEE